MNALRFIALVFILSATAWGQSSTDVKWERGGLMVARDGQVFAVFQGASGSEQYLLTNFQLAQEKNQFSDVKYKLELVTELIDGKGGTTESRARMVGFRKDIGFGAPISGISVTRVRFADGSMNLMVVVAEKTHLTSHGSDGAIIQIRAEEIEAGKMRLSDMAELKGQLPIYPNEVGLAKLSDSRYVLHLYDSFAGTLMVAGYQVQQTHDGKARLAEENSTVQTLPATFVPGKAFAEAGALTHSDPVDPQSFVLTLKSGETLVFGAGVKSNRNKKKNEGGQYSQTKLSSRVQWLMGFEQIAQFVANQQPAQTTAKVDLAEATSQWLAQLRATEAAAAAKGRQNHVTLLPVTVSGETLARFPELRADMVQSMARALQTETSARQQATLGFYLRLPEWSDSNIVSPAVSLIIQQINAMKAAKVLPEVYVLVDMLDARGPFYSFQNQRRLEVIHHIQQWMNSYGETTVRMVLIENPGRPELSSVFNKANIADTIATDSLLPLESRAEVVVSALGEQGYKIEPRLAAEIMTGFAAEGKLARTELSDLTSFAEKLATVLPHIKLEATDPDFAANAVKYYLRLTGERRVGPFPAEVLKRAREIPRLLSTSYPGHLPNALTGRDLVLRSVEQKLVSWLGYGHKRRAVKPLLFLGDHGTGKTTTALGIARALGAATEVVNMSAAVKPRAGYSMFSDNSNSTDTVDMKMVQDAIEKLVLDPNPVKVLVLDEIHATPGIFNALLPAFGDGDRSAPGVLNLDGLIVIMNMNVKTKNDIYVALSKLDPSAREYPQLVSDLVVLSLGGKESGVNPMVIDALAGRLMSDMIYYPALGVDRDQQASLLDQSIARFEQENKIRLVPQDAALEHLKKVAASYTGGNFRSVGRVLDEAITGAIGRFIAENPGRELKGYYVLGAVKDREKTTSLRLLAVEGDAVGMSAVVADTFDRYVTGVESSLGFAAEVMADGGEGSIATASRRNYETMLAAFKLAAGKAWTPEGSLGIEVDVPMPESLSPSRQSEVRQYLAKGAKTDFESFADYKAGPQDFKDKDSLVRISGQINQVFIALARVARIERESGKGTRVADWIETVRRKYVSDATAKGLAVNVEPNSIESMAVAAGYLADALGRRTATAMYSDMSKQANDEALLKSGPMTKGSAADLSAECQRLLTESQLRASDLDKILGK